MRDHESEAKYDDHIAAGFYDIVEHFRAAVRGAGTIDQVAMRIYDEDDERVNAWLAVWYILVCLACVAVIIIKHLI